MFKTLILVVLIAVLCLGATVGYFNAQPVEFYYLVGSAHLPLIALVIAVFGIAVLLTLTLTMTRIFGLKREIRRLHRQLRDAQTELRNLRDIPLNQEKQ
ncbi:MAG: LapA family protein [Cupriavidus sp.]|nr:MAG: LapA family protein [Cupriavidus sp.]